MARGDILDRMNRTHATQAVIAGLLSDPDGEVWAYDLTTRINSDGTIIDRSTVNAILRRMRNSGMLVDRWEDPNQVNRRPVRCLYKLTEKGKTELPLILGARVVANVAVN